MPCPPLLVRLFALGLLLAGCSKSADSPAPSASVGQEFNFETGLEGWQVDFSEYPVGQETFYELGSRSAKLPASTGSTSGAIFVTGNNHSDDLFMFLKRQFTGLKPGATYVATISLRLASQDAAQSVGIGGSPGASVFVKVGASPTEPAKMAQAGQYHFNLDKGNQASDGRDGRTVGDIGISGAGNRYQLIGRSNATKPLTVKTDASGAVWVFVGTDSGFEGSTAVYYDWVNVELKEK